jgi:hypothetical protein
MRQPAWGPKLAHLDDFPLISDPVAARHVTRANRATSWEMIHWHAAFNHEDVDDLVNDAASEPIGLSDTAAAIAVSTAHIAFSATTGPSWLSSGEAVGSPFDSAIVRLCHHHRLPSFRNGVVASRLALYVLTDDAGYLNGVTLAMVLPQLLDVKGAPSPDIAGSFSLTIYGLDEFVRQEDWEELRGWLSHRQNLLWEQRGGKPQGRVGPDVVRLLGALPVYRRQVIEHLSLKQVLAQEQVAGTEMGRLHPSSAAKRIRELRRLLRPED